MVRFLKIKSSIICTVIILPTGLLQKINRVSVQVIPLQTSYYILVDEIHQAFESTECLEIRAVFLDISNALDKVWHDGLIFKSKQNGISGNLLKLFQNYLSNRKQCAILNGAYSDYSDVESGVPPGSVLGPLLFLIYINDLERNINSNIKFFADDTMLFSLVKDPATSAHDLNRYLETIPFECRVPLKFKYYIYLLWEMSVFWTKNVCNFSVFYLDVAGQPVIVQRIDGKSN